MAFTVFTEDPSTREVGDLIIVGYQFGTVHDSDELDDTVVNKVGEDDDTDDVETVEKEDGDSEEDGEDDEEDDEADAEAEDDDTESERS
jgi:hypothetical protein